jgi:hypothetical protein
LDGIGAEKSRIDKKPRKRRCQKATVEKEQLEEGPQAVALKDDLEEKVHKWEVLKGQWNGDNRRNRERILCRKKELREAKERLVNETLGMQKMERRGRKPKGIDLDRIAMIKCLQH